MNQLDTPNDKPETILDAISIRPAHERDFALIYNSWIQGYKNHNHNDLQPYAAYKAEQSKIIERVLLRGAKILIACMPDDSNHILGWICTETIAGMVVVHWIYVKYPFRLKGIGKSLCKAARVDLDAAIPCTHATTVNYQVSSKYLSRFLPKLLEGSFSIRSTNDRSSER